MSMVATMSEPYTTLQVSSNCAIPLALHYWTAALLHGGAAWWTADGIVASADEAVIAAGCDLCFHKTHGVPQSTTGTSQCR